MFRTTWKALGTDYNAALWLCEAVGAVFGLEKPRSERTRLPSYLLQVQCNVRCNMYI